MSHYLSVLLDGAQGRGSVLERRKAPRFEGAAEPAAAPAEDVVEITPKKGHLGEEAPQPATQARKESPTPAPQTAPAPPTPIKTDQTAELAPLSTPRTPEATTILREEIAEKPAPLPISNVVARNAAPELAAPQPALSPAPRGQQSETALPKTPELAPPPPVIHERTERTVVEPLVRREEVRIPTLAELPSRLPAAPRPAEEKPAKPEASAIHVSIGRIEVRANVPSPTSRPGRSPSRPKMELDAYLQTRAGGGQ